MSELDDNTGNVEVEKEAMSMGWTPKEKFKGDPAKWIDAETFVERAEHVLPILRADRDRLKRDLLTRDNEIGNLKQQLGTTNAIVKDLTVQYDERLKAELAAQRRSLKAQLKEAVEDRDVDAEMEVREQLDQLTEAERAAQERAKQTKDKLQEPEGSPDTLSREFREWNKENPWYGGDSKEDRKRTKAILRIAEDLRDDGELSQGREFMDLCLEKLEEQEGGTPRTTSKVESGSPRGKGGGGSQSYDSLPADAKAACKEFAADLVGEGKVYKTLKEFQTYYAKTDYESN